ncbi:MAG: DMT family transporter [Burkholderiaceae bacterium]
MSSAATPAAAIPPRAIVLVIVLTLVWGTNWPLFPLAVREISVWTFRAVSVTMAGAFLLLIAHLRGQSLAIPRRAWPILVLAASSYLVVWNIASTFSAVLIPSGQSAVLGFTMPLWAALLAWMVLGQALTRRQVVAVVLGVISVGLLMVPGLGAYADAPLGFGLGLLAGFGWAVGTLILKRLPATVPPLVLTGWQLLIAAVPLTVAAFWLAEGPWFMPTTQSLVVIVYIALIPMSVGNAAWFTIAGLLPANVAGLSSVMVPVVAMISGAIVHSEPLGPLQLLAMACSMLALSLVLLKPRQAKAANA